MSNYTSFCLKALQLAKIGRIRCVVVISQQTQFSISNSRSVLRRRVKNTANKYIKQQLYNSLIRSDLRLPIHLRTVRNSWAAIAENFYLSIGIFFLNSNEISTVSFLKISHFYRNKKLEI